jgi:transposase
VGRLVQEEQLTAVLVLEELRELGHDGGFSTVKRYVRTSRPRPKVKPTTVLEHPLGDEGQVDWSPYTLTLGGERVGVHAFAMVLPFSDWAFLRFALDEQHETLVRLHDEAFTLLDAVPIRMSYDNIVRGAADVPGGARTWRATRQTRHWKNGKNAGLPCRGETDILPRATRGGPCYCTARSPA